MLTFEQCSTRTGGKIGKALCLGVQDGSGFQHSAANRQEQTWSRQKMQPNKAPLPEPTPGTGALESHSILLEAGGKTCCS